MSQEELNAALPTGSNWKAQAAGSAMTVIGARVEAAARLGLAAAVKAWKSGK